MPATVLASAVSRSARPFGLAFGCCALGFVLAMAAIAGCLPIEFSIASVFLCAGPHNWIEARYFLARLPARWGRLAPFFVLAFTGVIALAAGFAVLPVVLNGLEASAETWAIHYAAWNTMLAMWLGALVHLRSRQNPRRAWSWIWPVAFAVIALAWLAPFVWSLGLVYLHPLVALWILDREMRRTRNEYRRIFHACLLAIPACLAIVWWRLAAAPPLVGDDLVRRIADHAGAGLLTGVSSHCLVATHTFLEAVHYGVWLLAIPWLGRHTNLWNVAGMPLGRRSPIWRRGLCIALAVSAAAVVVLWLCFWGNYAVTRDVYFTLALVHVLAEVPFLLRAL